MGTQIVHLVWTQEQIEAAVAVFRERVREGDSEGLKGLLKQHAIEAEMRFDGETVQRAKSILYRMAVQDMAALFEPEPEADQDDNEGPTLVEIEAARNSEAAKEAAAADTEEALERAETVPPELEAEEE